MNFKYDVCPYVKKEKKTLQKWYRTGYRSVDFAPKGILKVLPVLHCCLGAYLLPKASTATECSWLSVLGAMPPRFLCDSLSSNQSWGPRLLLRLQQVPRCPGVPGRKADCCENVQQPHSTDSAACSSQFLTSSARKEKNELQCDTCRSGTNCCGLQNILNSLDYCFF